MKKNIEKMKKNLQKYPRYTLLGVVFLLVLFYNFSIFEFEKPKDDDEVDIESVNYFNSWDISQADLDSKKNAKIWENAFASQKGDYYRVGFMAKADQNVKLNLKIKSFKLGEKKIESVNLKEQDNFQYFEAVFPVDGEYQDFIIEKQDTEDTKVYISKFSVSRLNLNGKVENDLKKTIVGDTAIKKTVLADRDFKNNIFSEKNKKIAKAFSTKSDFLIFVDMNLNKIGSGGHGNYTLKLRKYDLESKKAGEVLKKIKFPANELRKFLQKDGNYRFEFLTELDSDMEYVLELSNEKVEVDRNNFVQVRSIDGKDELFALTLADYTKNSNKKILTNARIEDLGGSYLYQYSTNQYITDYFDVYRHRGEIKFDWEEKMLTAEEGKGSYFIYKINTIYPIERMRLEAKQNGEKKDEIEIFYSFDDILWEEIDYTQPEEESQIFDAVIEPKTKENEIYFRVRYNGDPKGGSGTFGLDDFKVSAYLEK